MTAVTATAQAYILGADENERARLVAQSEIHRAEAQRLLDRVQLRPGGRALDVGCGPLGVLDLLSERVGPTGQVVGLDIEQSMLAHAQRTITERHLTNVKLLHADAAATGLPSDAFDLAHERLVLINHPKPQHVVGEMVRVVRPGGYVAVQNVDWIVWTCEPPHPAWDQLRGAVSALRTGAGLNSFIGRRLPTLLRNAGMIDVQVDAHLYLWHTGEPCQTLLPEFIAIHREDIINAHLLDATELDRLTAELQEHLTKPDTFVIHHPLFQSWGRKPTCPVRAPAHTNDIVPTQEV
jgi:SAM-dependent methyltransferase